MVSRSYMIARPAPPQPWRVHLHQDILPVFINAVGELEVALGQLSRLTRRHPARAVGLALASGLMMALVLSWPAGPARRRR